MEGSADINDSIANGPIAVIRRRGDFVFGWIACAGLLGMMMWIIVANPARLGLWELIQGLLAIYSALWGAWLVTAHPKFALWSWGMDVTNWFFRYRIPWRAVRSVEGSDEVVIYLVDGGRIKRAVGAFSVISAKRGSRLQSALRERVEQARELAAANPEADTTVVRRLDVHFVPFLAILAGLMLLAWVISQMSS